MENQIEVISKKAFADYKKKDFSSAVEGFRACVDFFTNANSPNDMAEMKNNLSVALLELKDPEAAYQSALGTDLVFQSLGNKKSQAMALANLGTALNALGKKEEALAHFEQSSELFKEVGEKLLRATVLRKISDLQISTGKPLQAIASIQASYNQKDKKTLKEKVFSGVLGQIVQKFFGR
jgi:tetratricopeptide (TPR) repeat protein